MTENQLQKLCESYLQLKRIDFIHIPNEAFRNKSASILKGVPDLTIFLKGSKTLFVELKIDNGKLSTSQSDYIRRLLDKDHHVDIIKDFESFKTIIDKYEK